MSLGKVKLGTAFNKSYTHNLDFDNNTTMDFGTVQPLLCQYLFPRSDVKVNYRQLIRLAPMPTPSFARLFAKNYARFVPVSDVVPYYEALLSKKPFFSGTKSFVPRMVPYTSNRVLMWKILWQCHWTIYYKNSTGGYSVGVPGSDDWNVKVVDLLRAFHRYLGFGSEPTINTARLQSSNCVHTSYAISFEESDYIVPIFQSSPEQQDGLADGFVVFKFSDAAKRIRKQLVGLGYSLMLDDNTSVSLVPMLAYYKAYFDTFGLTRIRSYESTDCYALVRKISDYEYAYDLSLISNQEIKDNPRNTASFFDGFVNDFANLFYTNTNNFLAAHRARPNNDVFNPLGGVSFLEANGNNLNSLQPSGNSTHMQPTIVSKGLAPFTAGFTQLSFDLLKRVTRFVAKDSAIGFRISDWVRAHYGADVVNTLFEESNFVSESTTPIDISDVFSTSDTADIVEDKKGKGEYLGAYAGKGMGFNKNSFSFRARCHGYLFMFSCIVPQVRDFVGSDPTLYALDLDTIPVPDFDALGMELTPRGAVVGDNFICSHNEFTNVSFGFVPRYSGFKVKKDVVNGDMYCGYYKRDLQPYYLNRIPYNNYMDENHKVKSHMSPSASISWQVLNGNTSVGNFNRLFYDEGNPFTYYDNPDNFIVQTVFDFKVRNFLKPISESYETFDDSNDNNTTNVSAN
ncbi:hypothetical protein [Leyella stercorea]|uniref:hypothetical protein n=1 Tax=Leyella stercorea TaxID=363265 RepID=UPI0024323BD4|nr:hypothetical protein [Leyella stercorea]